MRKLFILGVDGATFDIMDPWMEAGKLPAFSKLAKEGRRGPMKSAVPPLSPVAWTSMVTGVNPGKHCIYDFWLRDWPNEEQYPSFTFATGADRKVKAFWELLSEKGKRCIVANMPCSFPPDPINGIMISGMDAAHDKVSAFLPDSIYDEVTANVGDYYLGPLDLVSRRTAAGNSAANRRELSAAVISMARRRREIYSYLASKHEWDVFFGVFTESDMAMHRFFDGISDPEKDPENTVLTVFQEIDQFIDELKAICDDEVDIMVVSDHGFTNVDAALRLNRYLEKEGFLVQRQSKKASLLFLLQFAEPLRYVVRWLRSRKLLPKKKRTGMKAWQVGIDYENSRVFFNGVYPYFHVLRHASSDEACTALISSLEALEFEGRKVFKEVARCSDVFSGPFTGDIPEVIGVLNEGFESSRELTRFAGNKDEVFCEQVLWEGTHSEHGIFMYSGAGVVPGEEDLEDLSVMDIAPTVLAHLGVPLSTEMDGKGIGEVLGNRQPLIEDYNIYRSHPDQQTDEDHMDTMEERLTALGYL